MRPSCVSMRRRKSVMFEACERRFVFSAPTGVLLNEVAINPAGTDNPYEYIELRGVASPSLQDVYVLVLEGDTGTPNPGNADMVVNLSAASFGSNGLLVVKSPTGGYTMPVATTVVTDAQLDTTNGGLENGTSSFLLVHTPTGLTEGADYDTNNDGVLELPGDATVLDSFAVTDGDVGDITNITYTGLSTGTVPLLTQPSGTPAAATRFPTDDTANEKSAWYNGGLSGTNAAPIYSAAPNRSENFPVGGALTPGDLNAPTGEVTYTMYFASSTYTVGEGAGTVTATITRSTTGAETSVLVSTSNGSATEPSDYTAKSETVTFAANENSKTFAVSIVDDPDIESSETFNITLSSPGGAGAQLGSPVTTVVTIQDNDVAGPPSGVVLNEIKSNPGGTDDGQEFYEVRGPANQSLTNVYFVSIDGDNTQAGIVNYVLSLSGNSLGSNGLLLVKGSTTGPASIEAATTVVGDPALNTAPLQNGSNSWFLVYSATAIALNTDLDTNNDGVLDVIPWGSDTNKLDSIAWRDAEAADKVYGDVVLTQAGSTPGAATRFRTDVTPNSAAAWFSGSLVGLPTDMTYTGVTGNRSANFPTVGVTDLTPGGANNPSTADTDPPTVSSIVYSYDTSGQAPSITVTFSEPVQATTLDDTASSSFTLIDRSTNLAIPASNFTLNNVSSTVAKITFNGANGAPANGDFKVTVNAGNVKDVANNALAASSSQNYSFLQGDATNDRKVNTLDFNVLAFNFGGGGKTFSQGDFNFNGAVDSTDFGIFVGATVYGSSLPAVPPPAPLAGSSALFGSTSIEDAGDWAKIFA